MLVNGCFILKGLVINNIVLLCFVVECTFDCSWFREKMDETYDICVEVYIDRRFFELGG